MFRLTVIIFLSLTHYSYAQNVQLPNITVSVDEILQLFKNITYDVNDAQICELPRRCVHHYQCLGDGTFNKHGHGVVNTRFADDNSNTIISGNEVYEVMANNTITQRNGVSANVCTLLEHCCGTKPISKIEIPSVGSAGCGYRNPDGIFFKINNPDKAQYCEFPWIVAVQWNHPAKNMPVLVGGGSLIHPNVILTAAHLLGDKTASEFIVRGGEWDTQTVQENLLHQERNVKQIILHESYDSLGLLNDFALLVLDTPFVLGYNIQPICLPTANLIFDGEQDCYSAGWGKDKFSHKERRQSVMKKVRLPIVPFEMCQEQLRQTQLGDIFELHKSFTCAGGVAGKDTCTGDGGSPLMCPVYNQKNRYYQTGIVAWGLDCGQENVPGVYANVALERNWIDDKMKALGYGSDSYSIN